MSKAGFSESGLRFPALSLNTSDVPSSRTVKRAVTREEHERIIAAESNPERRAYYELLWETGCSQTDAANLSQADIHFVS